ncbi:MAG: SH3 domain-containing protein [Desulfobacteraceae bacterium]|nr:SH3 domain-containing protein [Desulfobacteraceae bacterium]
MKSYRHIKYKTLGVLIVLFLLSSVYAIANERRCISEPIANVRSGPGTDYDIKWKVEKYHPIIILKKQGDWYQFEDFEKDKAWVHKSLVGEENSVITIKNDCNVRSGPGTNNKIVFKVARGVPFKVLGKKDSWYKVKHADGDQGWIHKTLVW